VLCWANHFEGMMMQNANVGYQEYLWLKVGPAKGVQWENKKKG
jgi:hypothetical protein